MNTTPLASFPPESEWDDWAEFDPAAWPTRAEKRYAIVPTICFNCEAACGLMAYVDKQAMRVKKLEGNPHHPGSRGKNCAKGPATLNQIEDPNRILYPLKRSGVRGSGRWERTTWDEVLDTLAARIRKCIVEGRRTEVMYHVGRPGEDGYTNRVLQTWGIDGHNSHTNVCSSSARLGYALWSGSDRPSPDHANAKFILMLSSHLETGHYFNPHAQRIIEGKESGAKVCVVDVRCSNTASKADWWLSPWPGTEAFLLLAMAKVILDEGLYDREFVESTVNWEETLAWLQAASSQGKVEGLQVQSEGLQLEHEAFPIESETSHVESEASHVEHETPPLEHEAFHVESETSRLGVERPQAGPEGGSFEAFLAALRRYYAAFTPEAAEAECGVPAEQIREIARAIGWCEGRLATHVWRNAAAGNLGGWQVSRCLQFLCVLVGAVGREGGTGLHSDNKFVPAPHSKPDPQDAWSELLYPREYPLAYHELSFLLPHMLLEGRGRIDTYFTRVYNPVWTNPDGMVWERVLKDDSLIGLHAALTPVWSETAQYADYVLPMGNGAERHDLMSQETHAGKWIGFRQPVLRVARERQGESFEFTFEANPGEVWEEAEFWIELSWRIDPDGSLGIRKHYESPYRPGEKIALKEYYSWIFENSVPGLPEAAEAKGLTPYEFMSRYGAFEVEKESYRSNASDTSYSGFPNAEPPPLKTPSKQLELFSQTMVDWGWPEHALPGYVESHVSRSSLEAAGEPSAPAPSPYPDSVETRGGGEAFVLIPTFRLPTLIHTRSANAKWLYELSNTNPVWMHTADADRMGLKTGDLVRVTTRIGYYVNRLWVTEAIRPGVIACSHHLGRWRLGDESSTDRQAAPKVVREEVEPGVYRFRRVENICAYSSADPDTKRIWWTDGGVHQNLTFPVQPDPVSGQHCWHQLVRFEKARAGDRYGDIQVDTNKSLECYREWLAMARPAPGPDGLRRPLWMDRVNRPTEAVYRITVHQD